MYARASLAEGLRFSISPLFLSLFAIAASIFALAASRSSQQSSTVCPRLPHPPFSLRHTGTGFFCTGTPLRPRFAPAASPRSCACRAWIFFSMAANLASGASASPTSALNATLSLTAAPAPSLRCKCCSARLMATSVSSRVNMCSSSWSCVKYSSAFFHASLSFPTLLSLRIIVCLRLERRNGINDLIVAKFFSTISHIFSNSL